MKLDFMSQINLPVICTFNGAERKFENGAEAREFYSDSRYEVTAVYREENAIRIVIMDKTEVREPSFNDRETYPDTCVSCGAPVPEGQMICWKCQHEFYVDEMEAFRPKRDKEKSQGNQNCAATEVKASDIPAKMKKTHRMRHR